MQSTDSYERLTLADNVAVSMRDRFWPLHSQRHLLPTSLLSNASTGNTLPVMYVSETRRLSPKSAYR